MDVLWKAFHLNWKEWPSPSCSVTKSCTALGSHGLQHARLLCPSLSPRVCSNSRPLSQQCYLTISSSAALLSFCHQSCPASGSFPVNQLFASRDQSTGASGSTISHSNYIQGWFPLGWTGLISLQSKTFSRVFSNTIIGKHQFFSAQSSLWSKSHICT